MAKKKTTTATIVTEDVPDGTVPGVQGGEFSFDTAGLDTDLLLDELKTKGSRVLIKVHKIVAGHRPIFQFETDSKVSEVQLQQYGGGLYTISYFIDGQRKHIEEIEVADKPADTSRPQSAESMQIMMLREQSQMNRDLLMAVLGRANPTVPAPTPMSEIAQMWGLIHGLNPANGGNQLFEALKMGIELASKGGNGDMDWKTALISTAKELAPGLLHIAGSSKGVDMSNAPVPGNGTRVLGSPDQLLKSGLALIKPKILAGLPVGLALDWVVANANDPQIQPFLALAVQKEFQDLVNADNEVANEPYNTWLRQFLSTLKEQFKQQAAEVSESEDEKES